MSQASRNGMLVQQSRMIPLPAEAIGSRIVLWQPLSFLGAERTMALEKRRVRFPRAFHAATPEAVPDVCLTLKLPMMVRATRPG